MAGIDRRTGMVIDNLACAYQGVEVTLSKRIGSVIMLREFGGGVVELLGRLVTPALFDAWKQLIATAIDLWEPRFRVRRVLPTATVDELRTGKIGLVIEADFRPRGHVGDFTAERVLSFSIFFGQRVRVS